MDFESTPQFKNGKTIEDYLDGYFGTKGGFDIELLTADEERRQCLGDRRFHKNDKSYLVEYKSGIQTFYTGNVFLETVSVDTAGKPGWVYTSRADFIVYAAVLNKKLLIFRPGHLRREIEALKMRFPSRKTSKGQNKDYNSEGVLVPLRYAEDHLAAKVIKIE